MRIALPLLLVFCAVGCRTPPPGEVAWQGVPRQSLGEDHTATAEDIDQAKKRIHLLRPDMTDKQVLTVLRLTRCYTYVTGSGPTERFRVSYDMLNGRGLDIVHDCTLGREVRLISVSVDDVDVVWKRDSATPIKLIRILAHPEIKEPEIRQVVARLNRLRPGMTKPQAWKILGNLPLEDKVLWTSAGSDWGEGCDAYLLKHGYSLDLLWDQSDYDHWKYRRAWLDHENRKRIEF